MDSELADFCEWCLCNIMLSVKISGLELTPINHEKSRKLKGYHIVRILVK